MIEHVFEDLCTGCGTCVQACPSHVFDRGEVGGAPWIARPDQCQTCFLCELYCPADALYVGPDQYGPSGDDPKTIRASGRLGQARRDAGWALDPPDPEPLAEYWRLGPLLREGMEIAAEHHARRNDSDPSDRH